MNIEKDLQRRIIDHFDAHVFSNSGYAYGMPPPENDHFWIRTDELTRADISFLYRLGQEYDGYRAERITIEVLAKEPGVIKICFS